MMISHDYVPNAMTYNDKLSIFFCLQRYISNRFGASTLMYSEAKMNNATRFLAVGGYNKKTFIFSNNRRITN